MEQKTNLLQDVSLGYFPVKKPWDYTDKNFTLQSGCPSRVMGVFEGTAVHFVVFSGGFHKKTFNWGTSVESTATNEPNPL